MRKIYLLVVVSFFFLIHCSSEKEEGNNPSLDITVNLKNTEGCKYEDVGRISEVSDTLSCIDYSYNQVDQKLNIIHTNAGFNCCPGKLSARVSIAGDTLILKEKEAQAACDCLCLFDLDIDLDGIEKKIYWLTINEPYHDPDWTIELDLTAASEGTICETRRDYPWGIYSW